MLAFAAVAVLALVAVLVLTAGGGAPKNTSAHATPSLIDRALRRVPARLQSPVDLAEYLPAVAAAARLPAGPAVTLVPRTHRTGSISLSVPGTWTDVDVRGPLLDDDNHPAGDIALTAVDISRLYDFTGAGEAVSIAVPRQAREHTVDDRFASTFIDHGCIDTTLVHAVQPMAGDMRIWAGCDDNGPVFLVGHFDDGHSTVNLFYAFQTRAEVDVARRMLSSLQLDVSKVRSTPASSGGDSVLP